jgi:hypothetical protein
MVMVSSAFMVVMSRDAVRTRACEGLPDRAYV